MAKPKLSSIRFRSHTRLKVAGVDVAAVEAHLSELHRRTGALTASAVLQAARRRDAPTHSLFEWDDHKAGHEFRLWQARALLGSLVIDVQTPEGELIEARRFVHIPVESCEDPPDSTDREGAYLALERVWSDTERRDQQAQLALGELRRWHARWRWLGDHPELAPYVAMIAPMAGKESEGVHVY